jgi:hypothetical protein
MYSLNRLRNSIERLEAAINNPSFNPASFLEDVFTDLADVETKVNDLDRRCQKLEETNWALQDQLARTRSRGRW